MADIRDPIHGFIEIGALEPIVDCPAMQRLRRIRQLARADLVYPGLMHSRFEHSLGVMHVAQEMAEKLEITEPDKTVLKAAALLHDVGHGPFSHVFEDVAEYKHTDVTTKIIGEDEQINSVFENTGLDPKEIIKVLKEQSLLHYIIDSPLDADKIDYLQRDSYHTRVAYGVFDYELLLHTLCRIRDPRGEYLGLLEKGAQNALSFVLARHLMLVQVYHHKVRRITDNMLRRAIQQARLDGLLPPELFDITSPDFLKCYLDHDDETVCHTAMSKEGLSKRIFSDIQNRRLFKNAFEVSIDKIPDALKRARLAKLGDDKAGKSGLERQIAQASKSDPAEIIVDVLTEKNPFNPHVGVENEIMIQMKDGTVQNLSQVLPFQSTKPVTMDLIVICPGPMRVKVNEAANEVLASY